ncbi:MAG: hypothetical protein ACRD5J_14240 [Nitrososphaeraceae archaeon]
MMNDRDRDKLDGSKEINDDTASSSSRHNILALMDSFIEQIFQIMRTLIGISISALIIAPIAIGLSIFLIRPHLFLQFPELETTLESY